MLEHGMPPLLAYISRGRITLTLTLFFEQKKLFGALGVDIVLDAFDIFLKFGSKALQAFDLLVGLGQVRLKNFKNPLLAAYTCRIVAVERKYLADLFQPQPKLLEPVDLFELGQLGAGVVTKPVALTLIRTQQAQTFVVADGPWGHSGLFGELADSHFIFHSRCATLTLTSK